MRTRSVLFASVPVIGSLFSTVAIACDGSVSSVGDGDGATTISLNGGAPFYSTTALVTDARCIDVPNDPVPSVLALWNEQASGGLPEPWYGISVDGIEFVRVTSTSYRINFRYSQFDPLLSSPAVPAELESDPASRLHIVQFVTQPLDVFLQRIAELGGMPHEYVPHHTYVVEMDDVTRSQVEQLPFVRWVGPYHPAYRIEEELIDTITNANAVPSPQRYNIAVHRGNADHLESVTQAIMEAGGIIDNASVGDS